MRADGVGRTAQWTITEKSDEPRFILKATRLVVPTETSSPAAQIDEYIRAASERPVDPDSPTVFSVKSRRQFDLDGLPAGLVYATLREANGLAAIQGYFLLQIAPNEFIVLSVLMAEEEFQAVSPLIESSFMTARHVTEEAIHAARRERLERADAFLKLLDEEAMRTALDRPAQGEDIAQPRWYRLGKRLPDGTEQELGYMTVLVIDAAQGAANSDIDPKKWDPLEREPGLLVRLQVRTLLDENGTAVADAEGRYWVRWDRQREFWTSRTTQRQGKSSRTTTQLGVREAPTAMSPRPVLEVADVNPSIADAKPRRMKTPETAYLGLAEALVLPRLLARAGDPGEYSFHWFDPRSDRPTQRRDRLERTDDGFLLLSNSSPESPVTRQVLGKRGELLRQDGDDGSFTQAIEPAELLKLWRQKGLPTE